MSRDVNNKYWDEELETLPREELEKRQLKDLKEIVQFAYDHAPYYKRSFDEAGVPTMSPFTKKDFDEFQDTESRWFWQIGMRPNDRYVHALNFSLYVGGPDVIGAQNLGALCIWGGTLPSERLLFILKTYQPTIIWTSPSYAWQLGEKAVKSGIDPKKDLNIKKIIVAGELVFTSLRKHARPLIRFRTGDIGWIDNQKCKCGRTHGRIHINGRKDDMFIVSAVNVFPSDIEAVIRELSGVTGEYLIRVFEKDYTCKYSVEVEKSADNPGTDEEVAAQVSAALKARIGVKPAKVIVHADGGLDTRSEHKAKRIIDERRLDYSI